MKKKWKRAAAFALGMLTAASPAAALADEEEESAVVLGIALSAGSGRNEESFTAETVIGSKGIRGSLIRETDEKRTAEDLFYLDSDALYLNFPAAEEMAGGNLLSVENTLSFSGFQELAFFFKET